MEDKELIYNYNLFPNPWEMSEEIKGYKTYNKIKREKINEMIYSKVKGGNEKMNVKSRYEVISDLEAKKREYIQTEINLKEILNEKKRSLRDMEREVEDTKEQIKEFEESMKTHIETTKELIKSVDDSLKRFENLKENK